MKKLRAGLGLLGVFVAFGCQAEPTLHDAARLGQMGEVLGFLQEGGDVNRVGSHGHTALIQAAYAGQVGTCRRLIEAGIPIDAMDADGKTALTHAKERGHAEVERLLRSRGAVE